MSPPQLIALGLLSALTPFAIDLYLPSLPAIARDLDEPIAMVQLSITVYLAVFALAQLLLGPLSDIWGRRRTIGAGLALFGLGSLGCALAPTLGWLLAARALQALGGAAVAVAVPALVRDRCERDQYARVMGLVMLVMSLAPLIAPSIGSLIIALGPWRLVFVVLLGIVALTALLFGALIQETLHQSQRHAFDLGHILGNYGRLTRDRQALGYLAVAACSFAGMLSFIVASPFVYIELHGVPPAWFGLAFGVNVALAMLVSALNARLVVRLGAERLLRLGLVMQCAAGLLAWGLWLHGAPPLWAIALAAALHIGMTGLVLGNAMSGFMASFAGFAGTASAFAGTVRFGAGALAGTLVSLAHDGSARPLLAGLGSAGLLALLAYWALCRPRNL